MNLQQLGTCRWQWSWWDSPMEGVTLNGCESEQVNVNRYTFQSYANGKSAVRVAAKEVWFFHLVTPSDCLLSLLAGQTCRPTSVARWIESRPAVCTHGPGLLFEVLFFICNFSKKAKEVGAWGCWYIILVLSFIREQQIRCATSLMCPISFSWRSLSDLPSWWFTMSHVLSPDGRTQRWWKYDHILQRCSIPFLRS